MISPLVVAVSQRVDFYPERNERRDALDQRLIGFLRAAGLLPVPVPNSLCAAEFDKPEPFYFLNLWLNKIKPAALVLSGGNDLGECAERDRTEEQLLEYSRINLLPVLGICRGMQQMGVWAGAELVRVEGHIGTRHVLQPSAGKDNLPVDVNSFHQWSLATCPRDFEVIARTLNGEIEAIRHNSLPWEGWMWHPEREAAFSPVDLDRIKRLFFGRHA